MGRYLENTLLNDALVAGKMAFLSGPRQVGKTTLAKTLLMSPQNYFTWDDAGFRRAWSKDPRASLSERGKGPVVIDEVHKDRRWKARLKGVYDTDGPGDGLIVCIRFPLQKVRIQTLQTIFLNRKHLSMHLEIC